MKIEKLLLAMLLEDPERIFKAKQNNITITTFPSQKYRRLYQSLQKFYDMYNRSPKRKEYAKFLSHINTNKKYRDDLLAAYDTAKDVDTTGIDFEFLVNDFKNSVLETQYKHHLQEATSKIQKGLTTNSLTYLKSALFELDKLQRQENQLYEISEFIPELKETYGAFDVPMGITSGIAEVDELTWGWKPGDLILLLAGTGGGKSTTLMNFAYAGYKAHNNVLFVQSETDYRLLMNRVNARAINATTDDIRFNRLPKVKKKEFLQELKSWKKSKSNFYIYDVKYLCTPELIESQLHELMSYTRIDLVVVDYLGIIELSKGQSLGSIWENKGAVAEKLKAMARKYNVPVITAQQVTRDALGASSKRKPRYGLHDISMSIYTTYHADIVFSLRIKEPEDMDFSDNVEAKLTTIKNRQGRLEDIEVLVNFPTMTICIDDTKKSDKSEEDDMFEEDED